MFDSSFRIPGRQRRAFTLLELLLAASITAMVAMAGTSLVFAIANASESNRNNCDVKNTGHYAAKRIGRAVREARCVGEVSATSLTLWTEDKNGDDLMSLDEMALIYYDGVEKEIVYVRVDPSVDDATPVAEADFEDFDTIATAFGGADVQSVVWAEEIESLNFIGFPNNTETRVVDVRLAINNGEEEIAFRTSASPKAPADYLFMPEARIDPTDGSSRVRRKHFSRWEGFDDLDGE